MIIRLIAPKGWIFEKHEIIDNCQKNEDILFNLIGFQYSGAVVSSGSKVGPAGVTITLTSGESVYEAVTAESGTFEVGPILPGEYEVSAKHPHFSLSAPVKQNLESDCLIHQVPTVVGYQISGKVVENGQPVKGVTLSLIQNGADHGDTLSDDSGAFFFEKIAVGTYIIKASYVDADTGAQLTIEPEEQEITVSVDNADLVSNFEVTGMTVQGEVSDGLDNPLSNVLVKLGSLETRTDENGQFALKKVKPGSHKVQLAAADYDFDEINLEVSSKKAVIHTISPVRVAVCPKVDHDSAEIRVYKNGDIVQTTRSQRCFFLEKGDYVIGVVPLNGQNVHFTPKQVSVSVGSEPIKTGILFSRVYRPLTVQVKCLDENDHCEPENLSAVLTSKSGDKFDVTVTKDSNQLKISHAGLSPGKGFTCISL